MNLNFDFSVIQQGYEFYILRTHTNLEPNLKIFQARCINAVINGYDLVSLMPTSYGKTLSMLTGTLLKCKIELTFGIHLIVVPLTALGLELESKLKDYGFIYIHLQGDVEQLLLNLQQTYNSLQPGEVLHLITSPENLLNQIVKDVISKLTVVGFSVDEGHCVTQWGENFRTNYGALNSVRVYAKCPVSVYSATVTQLQLQDIMQKVGIRDKFHQKIVLSPDRPEIFMNLGVRFGVKTFDDICTELDHLKLECRKYIIFCKVKNTVTELFLHLRLHISDYSKVVLPNNKKGYMVEMFSGSTSQETKARIIEDFSSESGLIRILVATNAFGMGLNIPNLRDVFIYDLPDNFGDILQLAGRASRDGSRGICHILLPKTSTKPMSVSLKSCKCIRAILLESFCIPNFKIETDNVYSEHVMQGDCSCKFCSCCTNCKDAITKI